MDPYGYLADEGSVDLKEGIDLQDLRDPNKGADFEIDISSVKPVDKSDTSNKYFPGEEVYHNLLKVDPEVGDTCDREGLETFEVLERRMEDVTENKDGGVLKMVLEAGTGSVAPQGALVRVHYNAYKELDDEPFDSTRLRHEIEKFRLGIDGTVAGLHVAVATMKKGERSRFIFKPNYYYGELGCPPRIPPNCAVLFDIELVSFVEREGVDDYYQMTEGERKGVTFAFVCKVSKAEREEGNQLFNTNMIQRALAKYKRAAKILDDYHLKTDEEEAEQKKLLVKVYSNIALCCLRLKQNGTCITWCHKVIELDPSNVKAYFRKGQALHSMSEFENARTMYRKAQRLNEFSQEIIEALSKLEQDIKKFRIQSEDYRRMCQRMVSLSASDDSRTAPDNRESQRESSDPEEECSARFRGTVIEKLEEFKSDAEMTEMPFPEQSLSVPEIACIVEVAGIMGLNIQRHGAGNASRMVVVKSKQQLQF
ncbi:inactive peptidyl-prolyl cis-trans isomerase FKBP6-like [Littorina saxatilis]|uniref:inactive peptidyl-prolyl cis-trans isomerase FKBP6-like n=1 Tax=Littorina saxatilis TaxID=31220 RepID=UPI0038B5A515